MHNKKNNNNSLINRTNKDKVSKINKPLKEDKTRRIWDISNYQDTYVIIEHINKKYPNSFRRFKKADLNDGNLVIWQNLI